LPDPLLRAGSRAELSDYKGSGFDRGHMHPAANAKKTQQMMDETHFLSEYGPQFGPTFVAYLGRPRKHGTIGTKEVAKLGLIRTVFL